MTTHTTHTRYTVSGHQIIITQSQGAARIVTDLRVEGEAAYNQAIDGLESLLLSFAVNGLLTSKVAVESAIAVAVEAIAHNTD